MSWQSYVDEQVKILLESLSLIQLCSHLFSFHRRLNAISFVSIILFVTISSIDILLQLSPSGCLTLLINSTLVQLIASGMVTAAAIAGHDGNIWAKSNGFNASPDEVLLCICVYLAYNNCLLAPFQQKQIQVKRLLSNWGPNLAMGGVNVNNFK